jgi:hypothetical protein
MHSTLFDPQQARSKIMQRGIAIGDDWDAVLGELKQQNWEQAIQDVTDPSIQYPSYYTQPFHAYPQVAAAALVQRAGSVA